MSSDRVVTLKIDGELAKGGRVPLEVLAEKLKALQEFVVASAQAVRPILPKGKGNKVAQARLVAKDACRLVFREIRKNCLTLEAELPATEALFPEHVEWGLQSVDRAGAILWAIRERNDRRIAELVPESSHRLNILRKAGHLLPNRGDYTISLTTAHQFVDVQSQADDYIRHLETLFATERKSDVRTVSGEVYLVNSDAFQIGLKVRGRHLMCDLGPEVRPQIRDYSPGVIAEITGRADLTKNGKPRRILEATSIRPLGMEPLPWTRITYGNKDFHLREPLMVEVRFDDDGWTYVSKGLRIMGYGALRRDAASSFQQDFAACWDSIAEAPDEILSLDAIELKTALRSIVHQVGRVE